VQRKVEHVQICNTQDVEARSGNGLAQVKLPVCTLPSQSYKDIDLRTTLFGRSFALPIYVPGMTGGMKEGARINQNLAAAAEAMQIPMGVGSQRVMAKTSASSEATQTIRKTFELKRNFPSLFLIAF